MRSVTLAAALSLMTVSAHAADDFIKGVYASSQELCAQAKKDGIQSVIEAGNVLLTERGLESIEYNCEFLNITRAGTAPGWVVTALCQEPGYAFPDVLSVIEMNATQIDLVSVRRAEPEEVTGNGGSYYLCEGITLP